MVVIRPENPRQVKRIFLNEISLVLFNSNNVYVPYKHNINNDMKKNIIASGCAPTGV